MENPKIIEIKVYNTKGILLKNLKGKQSFDISGLSSGFYMLIFLLNGNRTERQFIKV